MRIDYLSDGTRLAFYTPDFLIRLTSGHFYLVETKGQQDKDVPTKARAAVEWCKAASTAKCKWEYLFVLEGVFQRFQGQSMAELARTCAPSLQDLVNEKTFREEMPLFADQGLPEATVSEADGLIDNQVLESLPDRLRTAALDAVALYRFFEKKPGANFAPAFTTLLGVVDETSKGVVLKKLLPQLPAAAPDQRAWFEPYMEKVDRRTIRHYEEFSRNLKKTLVYRNGVSPLGLLRNCLE